MVQDAGPTNVRPELDSGNRRAVKKVPEPWGEGFLFVRLVRRDIRDALASFRNVFPNIALRANKYELQHESDLDGLAEPILDLQIMGHDFPRWAALALFRSQSQVLISDRNDAQLRGLADALRALLNRRRRLRFLTMPWMLLPLSLLTAANLAIVAFDLLPEPGSAVAISGVILAGAAYSWWALRRRVVIPQLADSRGGFLRRNRDQIILALISAAFGAGLSAVVILLVR
jgi:hypothetical protein